MEKDIYKIINRLNGKIYIGQTNDVKRRFAEHKRMQEDSSRHNEKVLYQAIKKYGIENFDFIIVETNVENYNDREKYWIQYYNCQVPNGYNMTPGGEEPPIFHGEEHPLAQHSQAEIDYIISLLKNTELSFEEIAEISHYQDASTIRRINLGQLWKQTDINYPIRQLGTRSFMEERALLIIQDLQTTSMPQKEIAKKYGVGRSMVTMINTGKNFHQDGIEYPIRKGRHYNK